MGSGSSGAAIKTGRLQGPRKPGSSEEDCQAACRVGNSYVGFKDVNGSLEEGWGWWW